MNKTLKCKDCGNQFEFSEKDQEFFKKKGFPDPIRCKDCRAAKKKRREGNGEN